jgi:hypothetical protein
MTLTAAVRGAPLITALDPDSLDDPGAARAFASWSDAELTDAVAEVISLPKAEAADSFILHAPLEQLARTALLPLVEPAARDLARRRMIWLGATYARSGPAHDDGPGRPDGRSAADLHPLAPAAALGLLESAVDQGDLDGADAAVAALAAALPPSDLGPALTDVVLPRLSAAAHGNIFLFQLPRIAPRSPAASMMARGLVRELARYPDWSLTWQLDRAGGPDPSGPSDPGDDLAEALRRPRPAGTLDSNFIFPTMSLVERSGLARELLDGPTRSIGLRSARQVLLRIAAWSMLQDAPDQAPYGWSHCLTLPQAALGIATAAHDPADAIAIAATFVLGFRSTLGQVTLDPTAPPEPLATDPRNRAGLREALGGPPHVAAAAAWHAPAESRRDLVAHLAGYASVHPDAHLAKYTVACLDAASADPEATPLFLAAAAYLGAWWRQLPSVDPLLA